MDRARLYRSMPFDIIVGSGTYRDHTSMEKFVATSNTLRMHESFCMTVVTILYLPEFWL